ncbi:capsule assembly Wzi family protein [Pedobacter sp. AW31-3R]|uniref:capsule assembly Wzi family protein n=1 Tax=Pedobacter sp. AW31-3R TaxID=3445781 RepID=UPI003FA19500
MIKILLEINPKAIFTFLLTTLTFNTIFAQKKPIKFEIESQSMGTTNDEVPFWMRSNQFGSVPLTGISQSFIGRAYKEFSPLSTTDSIHKKRKLLDWGFGFEGRANIGKGSNLQLIEGYAKARIGVLNITAGRSRNVMGLNGDTTLSSGNFAISGNAPGVPRIELSIPEYYSIPVFDGLFSVKGNFLHGWFGRKSIYNAVNSTAHYQDTYFHQKSLYVRVGKADWRFKFYSGFNHQVVWGNEREIYGSAFKLSNLETFKYVLTGQAYGGKGTPRSKIGNQIGSLDLGVEYNFDAVKLSLYRQNFYDVGALSKLANIKDGLTGITIENKNFNTQKNLIKWKKVLTELFYTKDQAGYPWSKPTKSGDEDYYNNYYYRNGWSYMNMGLGNPLITRREDAKDGQESRNEYFINNRVVAIHLGLEGAIKDWSVLTKVTYSHNYGTFGTSQYGRVTGPIVVPNNGNVFEKVKQLSFYLESMKPLKDGINVGFATSFDKGELLNDSFGLILKINKSF